MAAVEEIVEAALVHAQSRRKEGSGILADQLKQMHKSGGTESSFIKWAGSFTEPSVVTTLDKKWLTLLFRTVMAAIGETREELDDAVAFVFPYVQINGWACSVPSHQPFDQLIISRRDPICAQLQAPFGWGCACSVLCLMEQDVQHKDAICSLEERVGSERLQKFLNWLYTDPVEFPNNL